MKTFLVPATSLFLSIAGGAFAQDNAPTTPNDCSSGSLTKCSSPNEPTDNGADINTNSGDVDTNNTAPDEQPTGASPVNPETNSTAAPRGASGTNGANGNNGSNGTNAQ